MHSLAYHYTCCSMAWYKCKWMLLVLKAFLMCFDRSRQMSINEGLASVVTRLGGLLGRRALRIPQYCTYCPIKPLTWLYFTNVLYKCILSWKVIDTVIQLKFAIWLRENTVVSCKGGCDLHVCALHVCWRVCVCVCVCVYLCTFDACHCIFHLT